MDIRVSGHQVDMGLSLQTQVEDRLGGIAERYFSRAISAQVTFGRGPYDHSFTCDIVAHVPQGVVLKGHGSATTAHAAFDQSAERIERQLRRYKRRLKDRHNQLAFAEATAAAFDASYTVFAPPPEEIEAEPTEDQAHPPIVAETKVDIPSASVADAVMLLDLRNTNALMFRNQANGQFNMVYRRGDGTIGWVEPPRD